MTRRKKSTTSKRTAPIEIAILGKGRAGTALWKSARACKGVKPLAWANREPRLATPAFWERGDVLLVAVPDDAIDDVARALSRRSALPKIVAHTSGVKGP